MMDPGDLGDLGAAQTLLVRPGAGVLLHVVLRQRAEPRAARRMPGVGQGTIAKALIEERDAAGHRFNCGVVYLPPSAARDGVAELIRVNPKLQKIFIITEKIAVRDAREIRALGQQAHVDIFGAHGLGVADAWNRAGLVRGRAPGLRE
jgi:hypothetical protein